MMIVRGQYKGGQVINPWMLMDGWIDGWMDGIMAVTAGGGEGGGL